MKIPEKIESVDPLGSIFSRATIVILYGTPSRAVDPKAGLPDSTGRKRKPPSQIACPEEIAFQYGWINQEAMLSQAERFKGNHYGEYLMQIADQGP